MAQRQHCRITSSRCYWKSHPMTFYMVWDGDGEEDFLLKKLLLDALYTGNNWAGNENMLIHLTNSKNFLFSFAQNRKIKSVNMRHKLGLSSWVQHLNLLSWKAFGSGSVTSSVLRHRLMELPSPVHSFLLIHMNCYFTVSSYLKIR